MPGLLDPIDFAGLHLRNRIVMPPMASGRADPDGLANDSHVEYHRLRAAAGTAMVIVEHSYVHALGRFSEGQLGVHVDDTVPGLARIAAAIKAEGAVACLQLAHAGSKGFPTENARPVAPSAIPHPYGKGDVPDELSEQGIGELIMAFGDAATRAAAAGFDAIEVHAAHGFLLCQFLSPLTNRRTDAHGGPVEKRIRLHCEIIREIRQRVGRTMAILVRLGADDETAGGQTIDVTCSVAPLLINAGADLLDVSGGLQGASPPWHKSPGYFVKHAQALKQVVGVPVMTVGGITEPAFADSVVREGRADLVGIGRAMIREPDWAARALRALSGRTTGEDCT